MTVDATRPARLLLASLGLADVLLGIFWVEFLTPRLFRPDHQLEPRERLLLDSLIIGMGALLFLMCRRPRYVGAILAIHGIVLSLVATESVLQMSELRARVTPDGRSAIQLSEDFHHGNVPNQTFRTYV